MRMPFRNALFALVLPFAAFAFATSAACAAEPAMPDVPEVFDSVPTRGADAYEFVQGCMPTTSQAAFDKIVDDAGDNKTNENKTVISRPADRTKSYIAVTAGRVYCVRMANGKYPIVPTSVFDSTISFFGMDKDQQKRMVIDLSRQLSARGFATATVVGEKDNVYIVTYLFSSSRPTKMYYHLSFLKAADMKDGYMGKAYVTQGNVAEVSRPQGSEQENVKFFFVK